MVKMSKSLLWLLEFYEINCFPLTFRTPGELLTLSASVYIDKSVALGLLGIEAETKTKDITTANLNRLTICEILTNFDPGSSVCWVIGLTQRVRIACLHAATIHAGVLKTLCQRHFVNHQVRQIRAVFLRGFLTIQQRRQEIWRFLFPCVDYFLRVFYYVIDSGNTAQQHQQ